MRWIVPWSIVLVACGGPEIPAHNGYKPKEAAPWKKPKLLKFDDKQEAKSEGDLSYPAMKRARWFEVDLPSPGQLALSVEITPPGDAVNEDFDLAMEVLDPDYKVIAKSDLEDTDAHELNKKKNLVDLLPGKYLIHLYLQGRLDTADFVLHAAFKSTAGVEAKTNFPAGVEFVPQLAMVPIEDDSPRRPPPPPPPHGGKHPPPPPKETPKVATVSARIIAIQVVGSGTMITVGRGTSNGASDGMKAQLAGIGGSFPLGNCNDRTCTATITGATPDQIKGAKGVVTLSP